ncbi:Protein ANTAGONIST OF LIKE HETEROCHROMATIN PROTEIN 1 [Labeo rohita]|uniref:Protein ANTAGONIST OF LIKE HETEROCHROMATIN PROTEIN 1 n=1 Tax=Labeo rohita TaxID=84645 RepID=A0ABQ8L682_LABRO|nr:Protein ANTAGONIST OF LIKE HETEROCHROMATIN PROTEIN 1 [Labeo rohita]
MPVCVGAIDGTHIPIISPRENPADYHNRKGWHSIILQGIADHKMLLITICCISFTDVYVGWPGRTHDARVLADSDIYCLDPAYPLKKWLIKAFPNSVALSQEKRHFNHRLSSARIVVENASERLKGRWRCLLKRNDININTVSNVVLACCV